MCIRDSIGTASSRSAVSFFKRSGSVFQRADSGYLFKFHALSLIHILHEMVENDLLYPGQTLACIGFGGGLTWGGMLLTYEGRK